MIDPHKQVEFGDVFAWGDNSFGQLGTGNTESCNSATYLDTIPDKAFAAKIVAGEKHTIIIVTGTSNLVVSFVKLSRFQSL